jgi:4a-hydroxytetrahydrobiopterin dehydratase
MEGGRIMGSTPVEALGNEARDAALQELSRWGYDAGRDALHRRFDFPDFLGAWGFMARVALLAERADHHPEWSNVYGRVDVWLRTHDADGVSGRDVALAREIDALGA